MFVKFILHVLPKFILQPSTSVILLEAASFQKRKGKGSESEGEEKLCVCRGGGARRSGGRGWCGRGILYERRIIN